MESSHHIYTNALMYASKKRFAQMGLFARFLYYMTLPQPIQNLLDFILPILCVYVYTYMDRAQCCVPHHGKLDEGHVYLKLYAHRSHSKRGVRFYYTQLLFMTFMLGFEFLFVYGWQVKAHRTIFIIIIFLCVAKNRQLYGKWKRHGFRA